MALARGGSAARRGLRSTSTHRCATRSARAGRSAEWSRVTEAPYDRGCPLPKRDAASVGTGAHGTGLARQHGSRFGAGRRRVEDLLFRLVDAGATRIVVG